MKKQAPVLTAALTLALTASVLTATPLEGMFRYTVDSATFVDCKTGQRVPVAMEADYKSLEKAYIDAMRQAGIDRKVEIEGHTEMRPKGGSNGETLTLVVERYITMWPGETCDTAAASPQLQDTYWKVTRLRGKPVIISQVQREPNLLFRAQQNKMQGFAGCNSLTGNYQLNGTALTLSGVAVTQTACPMGMDIESTFLQVLEEVRTWKITAQHLELYDAGNNPIARLEERRQ